MAAAAATTTASRLRSGRRGVLRSRVRLLLVVVVVVVAAAAAVAEAFVSRPPPLRTINRQQQQQPPQRRLREDAVSLSPLPPPPPPPLALAAASDSGGGPESEEARRKRIMALQREVAEDILAASETEREAAEAKKREMRLATRRKVYEAYSKVGGEVSLSQIGVPKKMTRTSKKAYAEEEKKLVNRGKSYAARKFQLQFDSLWLSTLGLAAAWAFTSFEGALSYGLGALLGLGYVTLLARSVEAIGTGGPGAGVGQARFGMVILLVLFAGKYRDTIQLVPALVGFSMYQVASFLQAFERDEDPPAGPEEDGEDGEEEREGTGRQRQRTGL